MLDWREIGCQQRTKITKRQQRDGKLGDKEEGYMRDKEDERKEGAGKRRAGMEMGWVVLTRKGKGKQNTITQTTGPHSEGEGTECERRKRQAQENEEEEHEAEKVGCRGRSERKRG